MQKLFYSNQKFHIFHKRTIFAEKALTKNFVTSKKRIYDTIRFLIKDCFKSPN